MLVPNTQNTKETTDLLKSTKFDTLIVEAGSISVDALRSSNKSLRHIIWVARGGAMGTDWDEGSDSISTNEKFETSTWHELVQKDSISTSEVPSREDNTSTPSPIFGLWQGKSGKHEFVEYTHAVG